MKSKSTKDKWYEHGFTRIPNAIVADEKVFESTDKLVILVLSMYAFGQKTDVRPSERLIAAQSRLNRRTVGTSLKRLLELKVIEELERDGRGKATYRLNLGADWSTSAPFIGAPVHHKTSRLVHQCTPIRSSKKHRKDAPPTPGVPSATDATSGEDGLGHSAGSAPSPESALPSDIEVSTASSLHGIGAADATHPGRNGRNTLQSSDIADEILNEAFGEPTPQAQYTKRDINDLLLTPEGLRVSSNRDDLEYDLQNEVLPMLAAEYINDRALAKLIELRGVGFCQLWQHWLPRKVASYYEKGESIDKPTGLYIEAVREGWEVDPAWPQFDEELHTVAARAEARKRQKARGPKAPVPGTSYTQDDVNRFADEVRSGERNLIYLPMQLQGPVRTRLDELYDAEAEAEEIPF